MIVMASGHRLGDRVGGYGDAYNAMKATARKALKAMAYTPDKVLSGMAVGWDQAVAEVAIEMGIPLVACVPCEDYGEAWPKSVKKRYKSLLDKADDVVIVTPGKYQLWKLFARNEYMLSRADAVLALWDGGERGGTSNVMSIASHRGIAVFNEWDNFCRTMGERNA